MYSSALDPSSPGQVGMQLEAEKAALLQKKREQQVERKRKQEELDRILQENKRKVSFKS
jgi:arginine/glutamate-rich protein 1